MWTEIFFNFGFATFALSLSLSNSFLFQNAPAALTNLATSASASASVPLEPMTHIADLRRKQEKAEQLQSEKLIDGADSDLSLEPETDTNEAAPSLLQKKIGKILAKLRFISSLGNRPSANGGDSGVESNEMDESSSSISNATTTETTEMTDKDVNDLENDIKTTEEATTRRTQTFQKIIYPHSNFGAPLKVSFDVNERIVNQAQTDQDKQQSENIETVEDTSRLGQIGVFFAEVLGSIVGLLYGAAAQITNGSNGANLE